MQFNGFGNLILPSNHIRLMPDHGMRYGHKALKLVALSYGKAFSCGLYPYDLGGAKIGVKETDLFYATLSVGALSRGDVLQARNSVLPAK